MFTLVWSFWNLFTFEVNYKSYQNRDIAAEYMPAIISNNAILPIAKEVPLESDIFFSIFFSFLLFSVLFLLSVCSKRFLRLLLLLIVLTEFFISRLIISYFKHEYTQLLILRVFRLSALLFSLFLLCLSCCFCQFVYPEFKDSKPKFKRPKSK